MIAIDGPAASGKGTIAAGVAQALGFHLLDSGSLYRLVALQGARRRRSRSDDEPALAARRRDLDVALPPTAGSCSTGRDVTDAHPRART